MLWFDPDVPASVIKKKKRRGTFRNKHLESLDQDWMVIIDLVCYVLTNTILSIAS